MPHCPLNKAGPLSSPETKMWELHFAVYSLFICQACICHDASWQCLFLSHQIPLGGWRGRSSGSTWWMSQGSVVPLHVGAGPSIWLGPKISSFCPLLPCLPGVWDFTGTTTSTQTHKHSEGIVLECILAGKSTTFWYGFKFCDVLSLNNWLSSQR